MVKKNRIKIPLFSKEGWGEITQLLTLQQNIASCHPRLSGIGRRNKLNEEPSRRAARYLIVKSYYFHIRSLTPQQAARNALAIRFNKRKQLCTEPA